MTIALSDIWPFYTGLTITAAAVMREHDLCRAVFDRRKPCPIFWTVCKAMVWPLTAFVYGYMNLRTHEESRP